MPARIITKPNLDAEFLRARLKLRAFSNDTKLQKKDPRLIDFFKNLALPAGQIKMHSVQLLSAGALAGTMLLSAQITPPATAHSLTTQSLSSLLPQELNKRLVSNLEIILPSAVRPLTTAEEQDVSGLLKSVYDLSATAILEGNKLNQSYGLIGAEQHLPRYPGDASEDHGQFINKGVTPGRGAWGYFSSSRESLTDEMVAQEKYYVAVQTLYLPDWNTRFGYLKDWYKYRRVVVVNPKNGKTAIAVVADAGPAAWTGKHFGGSPELMAYLGLNTGMQKGPVVLFFLDNSQRDLPLGPVEYNVASGNPVLANKD